MINYFAYGSNISVHRMVDERKVNIKSRLPAVLENYKLVFNKVSKNNPEMGYANIVESIGSFVEGAIYEMDDTEIKKIDKFEGFPIHYDKRNIEVTCGNEKINAVVYTANPSMIKENIKPIKEYLDYILEGKDIFSETYYDYLKKTETLD